MEFLAVAAIGVAVIGLLLWGISRPNARNASRGPGAGAAGAIYDMLNEDKRKAIEIIVEQKAEATDPETADDVPEPDDPDENKSDQDSAGSTAASRRRRSNV